MFRKYVRREFWLHTMPSSMFDIPLGEPCQLLGGVTQLHHGRHFCAYTRSLPPAGLFAGHQIYSK